MFLIFILQKKICLEAKLQWTWQMRVLFLANMQAAVPAMKQAAMVIVDHCSSTDDSNHHDNCPKGDDSWCFHQKAQARGLPPGSHINNVGTLPCELIADHVRLIFVRLSSNDLLGRCIQQTIQNANKSAHSVIWACCPKHQFVNRNRLFIAVSVGVAKFNLSAISSRAFLESLSLPVGEETKQCREKRDHMRTMKAQAAVTEKATGYRQMPSKERAGD